MNYQLETTVCIACPHRRGQRTVTQTLAPVKRDYLQRASYEKPVCDCACQVDSLITPEAAQRLSETPSAQELRAMRELELLLLEKKANALRQALDNDQSDISTAFAADRLLNTKGWEQ